MTAMTVERLKEPRRTGEFILSEPAGLRARDAIKMAAGSGVVSASTVIGKIASTGQWKPHDPAAMDGSQQAAGILYATVEATAEAVTGVALVRDCEVKQPELIYHASVDTPAEQAVVHDQLRLIGVVVR
jgi:hypothetical protein